MAQLFARQTRSSYRGALNHEEKEIDNYEIKDRERERENTTHIGHSYRMY